MKLKQAALTKSLFCDCPINYGGRVFRLLLDPAPASMRARVERFVRNLTKRLLIQTASMR